MCPDGVTGNTATILTVNNNLLFNTEAAKRSSLKRITKKDCMTRFEAQRRII